MAEGDFQQLLDVMPKIAEAVKDLPDGLKQRAFEELISTFKGVPTPRTASPEVPPVSQQPTENGRVAEAEAQPEVEPAATGGRSRKAKKATTPRKATTRKTWAPDRHIDFWPEGKQSFKDFVEEKQPASLHQKNLLAVFWLEQVAELPAIGVSQVLAAYKALDWDEPSSPDVYLRKTASAEHWIDTRKSADIKTTPGGRNMVKSMPLLKGKR
ncbi:hypothetical protein ACQPZK_25410 [Micromonospora sp. CA-249363]|uniref:hypothetical protein n=1 Tax=Micromonospora sp. CA-249363 TaxID=3239963 RepID=UPI003D8F21B2